MATNASAVAASSNLLRTVSWSLALWSTSPVRPGTDVPRPQTCPAKFGQDKAKFGQDRLTRPEELAIHLAQRGFARSTRVRIDSCKTDLHRVFAAQCKTVFPGKTIPTRPVSSCDSISLGKTVLQRFSCSDASQELQELRPSASNVARQTYTTADAATHTFGPDGVGQVDSCRTDLHTAFSTDVRLSSNAFF